MSGVTYHIFLLEPNNNSRHPESEDFSCPPPSNKSYLIFLCGVFTLKIRALAPPPYVKHKSHCQGELTVHFYHETFCLIFLFPVITGKVFPLKHEVNHCGQEQGRTKPKLTLADHRMEIKSLQPVQTKLFWCFCHYSLIYSLCAS